MLRMRVSLTLCECREGKCKNQKITLQGKPAGALLSRVRCVTHDLADISVSHIPPLVTNHQRDAFLHMSSCVLHGCDRRPSHGPLPGLSSEGTSSGTGRGGMDRQQGHVGVAWTGSGAAVQEGELSGGGRGHRQREQEGDRRRSRQWGRQRPRPLIRSPALAHGRWGGQEPGLAIPPHLPTPSPAPAGCLKGKP